MGNTTHPHLSEATHRAQRVDLWVGAGWVEGKCGLEAFPRRAYYGRKDDFPRVYVDTYTAMLTLGTSLGFDTLGIIMVSVSLGCDQDQMGKIQYLAGGQ